MPIMPGLSWLSGAVEVIATTNLDPLIVIVFPGREDQEVLARGDIASLAGAHRILGLVSLGT